MPEHVRITRAIEFSSSLRLERGDLAEDENRRLFGRYAGRHGHNYRLEVTLAGAPDPVTGMLVDLKDVKDLLEREVMERFDHRDLNDDTGLFEKEPPTAENLASRIFVLLAASMETALPGATLERVRLYAGADHWVDVEPEPA